MVAGLLFVGLLVLFYVHDSSGGIGSSGSSPKRIVLVSGRVFDTVWQLSLLMKSVVGFVVVWSVLVVAVALQLGRV